MSAAKKRPGRKPRSGAVVTRDEVRAFWMMFRAHQGRAAEMSQQGANGRQIERMMTPLAFHAMNILVGKAENLPEVKRFRQAQLSRREPHALQKQRADALGVTRQTLLARRKKMDK